MDKTVNPCKTFTNLLAVRAKKQSIPSSNHAGALSTNWPNTIARSCGQILEKATVNDPKRTPVEQKVGDMYQSCMDESASTPKASLP